MAILRINATRDGVLSLTGGGDWQPALARAAERLTPGAPVVILVHGYRFTWVAGRDGARPYCPQDRLYRADGPVARQGIWPRLASWPHSLGFTETGAEGLCIGFGWDARRAKLGTLIARGRCDFAEVFGAAAIAGEALARVTGALAAARPGVAPAFLTHSLGARVALAAMGARPDLAHGPSVLLGAAEFTATAGSVLAAQAAAGGGGPVTHVLSRANDLFDAAFATLAPVGRADRRTLGHAGLAAGLPGAAARWLDLQLDAPATAAAFARRGVRLERSGERVSHWHFYTDPGAMEAWSAILRGRPGWDLASLRADGLAEALAPRWSRLIPAARTLRPAAPSGLDQPGRARAA